MKLEAEAFELGQKVNITTEAKAVLDSWVRYEGQVKTRQQRELADSIIGKIDKELENPKVLKQILDQAVADVERKSPQLLPNECEANIRRNCLEKGMSLEISNKSCI